MQCGVMLLGPETSSNLSPHLSATLTFNTGSPQGCVLRPLLYALFTNGCIPFHLTNTMNKFVDDIIMMGLISIQGGGGESVLMVQVTECSLNQKTDVWGTGSIMSIPY